MPEYDDNEPWFWVSTFVVFLVLFLVYLYL